MDATNLAFDDVVQHVMFLFPALRGKPFSVRYQDEEGASSFLPLTRAPRTYLAPSFNPSCHIFLLHSCFQNTPLFAPR